MTRNYRSRHRKRSHDAAHAEADLSGPQVQAILEDPRVPANEPHLITEQRDLEALLDRLRKAGSFAYDSEFIGEETYYPRLCVIQVATHEEVALIDAMTFPHTASQQGREMDSGLLPFWQLLADPAVEKIVHAGQQDLEPVVRHLDQPPANIFDTQVAAGFAGLHYPSSLSRLISELIGPEVAGSVGAKFSQWDRRPLTPVQMRYAANDVRYLPLLRHRIGESLGASGNVDRARAEFEELCDVCNYRFDASSRLLRGSGRGQYRLSPAQRSVLHALLRWRDAEARQRDVPPRSLIPDGVLHEMARSDIADVEGLRQVRGLPRSFKRRSEEVLALMEQARASAPPGAFDEPATPNLSRAQWKAREEAEQARVEALWHAVRERAQQHAIDPSLVTSKREVTMLVRGGGSGDLRLIRSRWRHELIADLIDDVSAQDAEENL